MSEGVLSKSKESLPIPGIGIGGEVFCPYGGLQRSPCLKGGCELWVVLSYGEKSVGRCSHSWNAILACETRMAIDRTTAMFEKLVVQQEEPPDDFLSGRI